MDIWISREVLWVMEGRYDQELPNIPILEYCSRIWENGHDLCPCSSSPVFWSLWRSFAGIGSFVFFTWQNQLCQVDPCTHPRYESTSRKLEKRTLLIPMPKTQKKFSCMPIDQAHLQNNDMVKGKGGAIGLTENPAAFRWWMVAGPEQARVLIDFKSQIDSATNSSHLHHKQNTACQNRFQKHDSDLCHTISYMGNPFQDTCQSCLY